MNIKIKDWEQIINDLALKNHKLFDFIKISRTSINNMAQFQEVVLSINQSHDCKTLYGDQVLTRDQMLEIAD